jgi:hypothetical protein
MKPCFFVKRADAEKAYLAYIERKFSNPFESAFSIARIQVVELPYIGFSIRNGQFGDYLTVSEVFA